MNKQKGLLPREHPILFSGPMVRAILEGRKTQTRRVWRLPFQHPNLFPPLSPIRVEDGKAKFHRADALDSMGNRMEVWSNSPYGKPGDLLWVRETWGESGQYKDGIRYEYQAFPADGRDFRCVSRWRPSIHMPRAACRLVLRVTDVRVQRLQDISEGDAMAEGIRTYTHLPTGAPIYVHDGWMATDSAGDPYLSDFVAHPVSAFESLWDSINGKKPGCDWASNPWTWAVSFAEFRDETLEVTK